MANVITDFRFYMARRHRPELAYVGYEEAEKIVVLADPKSLENAEPLLRQLHTDGKAISLFVYNPLSEPLSGDCLPGGCLHSAKRNWVGCRVYRKLRSGISSKQSNRMSCSI